MKVTPSYSVNCVRQGPFAIRFTLRGISGFGASQGVSGLRISIARNVSMTLRQLRNRHRSEPVNVDHGQLVGRRLKDCPVVADLPSSAQSLGAPRAGETGGGSSGSQRYVRIFRIGPGSVMRFFPFLDPPRLYPGRA